MFEVNELNEDYYPDMNEILCDLQGANTRIVVYKTVYHGWGMPTDPKYYGMIENEKGREHVELSPSAAMGFVQKQAAFMITAVNFLDANKGGK